MKLEWRLPAKMFVQQLPSREQTKLMYKVETIKQELEAGGPRAGRKSIVLRKGENQQSPIYEIRAEPNLKVIYTIEHDKVVIIDVIRETQIDKLRSIIRDRA